MKRFTSLAAAFVVLNLGVSTAQAVVLFEDNFNAYPDQPTFQTTWKPIGCTQSGITTNCTVTLANAPSNELSQDFTSDPNHLQSLLNHSPVGSPGTGDSSERNELILGTPTPVLAVGDKLVFSFDFFDVRPDLSPARQFADLRYFNSTTSVYETGTNQLISMGLNNNQSSGQSGGNYYMARVLGYSNPLVDPDGGPDEALAATNYVKMNDFSTGTSLGPGSRGTLQTDQAWHNLKVEISTSNGTSQDYKFYVDNVLAEKISNVGTVLRQYNVLRIGSGVSATFDAYYDNIKVEYIPVAACAPGDFNCDGHENAGDYVSIRKQYSDITSGAGLTAYNAWRTNFGNPAGAGSGGLSVATVPEPATLVMAMLAMAFGIAARRRQA